MLIALLVIAFILVVVTVVVTIVQDNKTYKEECAARAARIKKGRERLEALVAERIKAEAAARAAETTASLEAMRQGMAEQRARRRNSHGRDDRGQLLSGLSIDCCWTLGRPTWMIRWASPEENHAEFETRETAEATIERWRSRYQRELEESNLW